MQIEDVDGDAVTAAVGRRTATFSTRHVSEDVRVTAAHPRFVGHPRFHVTIGRYLGRSAEQLGVEKAGTSSRGALWQRLDLATSAVNGSADAGIRRGIGPQVRTDAPWIARMRLHQSWWRDEVLGLSYGTGPSPTSTRLRGSMLDERGEELGANFVSDAARLAYESRAGSGVELFRARRNLLSSQPMCINIFGPLSLDLDLATRVLQQWLPGQIKRVVAVRIEYAPEPRLEFLNDRTSFDAFVEYEDAHGQRAFLAVETKLTEPFTATGGYHRRSAYRRLTEAEGSPWRPGSVERLGDVTWCQLWRNHLLVEALRRHPDHDYSGDGRLLVLHHHLDPGCHHAVSGYRQLLTDVGDADVLELTLDSAVDAACTAAANDEERSWADALRRRYADLSGSEHLVGSPQT